MSEYVGSGELGALAAALDRHDRAARDLARAEQRAQREDWQAEERDADRLAALARNLATLALLAAGWHQHKRTWRKRRFTTMAKRVTLDTLPARPAPGDHSREAALILFKRCNQSYVDPTDINLLRALLKAKPDIACNAGLIQSALDRSVEMMNGTPAMRKLAAAQIEQRRAALGYDTASPLEKPLIDHLLLCEYRLGAIEQAYTAKWQESMSVDHARFWEARLSAAQRRYLAAVETLARVRRVRVELSRMHPDGSAEAVAVEKPGA